MNTTTLKPHQVAEENARKFADWITNRGGILVWQSRDLGSAGRSVSTPALTDGKPTNRPGWQFTEPDRHITDMADVEVFTVKVVESFPIKLKQSQGRLVLNNASDRKVRAALDKAGADSFYRFESSGTSQGNLVHGLSFGDDTIQICVDDSTQPLAEWLAKSTSPTE